ncbi:MAG: hypothetical protein WCJ30_15980, partial [Deltaproteobacteria bacterium]
MTHTDDPHRSRAHTASGALLSAALGGLLCFGTSCRTNGQPATPDTGVGPDVAASADVITPTDAGADAIAPTDGSTLPDVIAAPDVASDDALADATASLDASLDSSSDAAPDAAPALDSAVDAVELGCDVSSDRVITSSDASPGLTLEAFTATCNTLGGHIE